SDALPYERPYGPLFPISSYALVAQRHMYEHGTTREQLAQVAVTARQWAALNPGALKPEPITVEEVIASPLVSDPLRRLDCCLVSNGGGAVVVTTADRARNGAGKQAAREHVRRRARVLSSRDVRHLPARRDGAPAPRGVRRASGRGRAPRCRSRLRRRVLRPCHRRARERRVSAVYSP